VIEWVARNRWLVYVPLVLFVLGRLARLLLT
jgi:hypothetical protein